MAEASGRRVIAGTRCLRAVPPRWCSFDVRPASDSRCHPGYWRCSYTADSRVSDSGGLPSHAVGHWLACARVPSLGRKPFLGPVRGALFGYRERQVAGRRSRSGLTRPPRVDATSPLRLPEPAPSRSARPVAISDRSPYIVTQIRIFGIPAYKWPFGNTLSKTGLEPLN